MKIKGAKGYCYWPEYNSRTTDSASKIITTGFWELVALSPYNLYPPETLAAATSEINVGYIPKNLSLSTATFNLLDSTDSNFILPILSKFGLEDIVVPNEMVRSGLQKIRPGSMRSITPESVLSLLRSSPIYCARLLEAWGQEHSYSIDFFNTLLSFITRGTHLSLLIGCSILPLANCTLGTFLPKNASQTFLVAATSEESEILEVSQDLVVHPGLSRPIVDRLISYGELNIARFKSEDVARLHPAMEERDITFKKAWIAKVWQYLKRHSQHPQDTRQPPISYLQHLPMYFGKVVGEPDEKCVFICPSEFHSFIHPAILEPSDATRSEKLALESLKGAILLDRAAFLESESRQESIRTATGAYRVLKCIEILAAKNGLFIEEYLTKTVLAERITVRYISPLHQFHLKLT